MPDCRHRQLASLNFAAITELELSMQAKPSEQAMRFTALHLATRRFRAGWAAPCLT